MEMDEPLIACRLKQAGFEMEDQQLQEMNDMNALLDGTKTILATLHSELLDEEMA